MNNKGIVFFDVDGTLIDCGKGIYSPTKATKEAISKLKENGYLTFLATGRPKNSVTESIKNIGLNGYVTSNGSYAELEGEVLFNECIDNEKLKEVLSFLEDNNITYLLEAQEKNYVLNLEDERLRNLIIDADLGQQNISKDWNKDTVKVNKIIAIGYDEKSYDLTYNEFSKKGFALMANQFGDMFEIYAAQYTKGYGVEHLLERLDIDKEDAYAFGDGENDIEMFQAVKHGIAMKGYHKGLEPHAFDFTEDVENEGICKGLEKLGII